MRKFILMLAAAAAFNTAPAVAHPEDEDNYTRGPTTAEKAQMAIEKLVTAKKLPASWTAAKLVSFDFRSRDGKDQYVLIFENAAIKQATKRKLYVLMTTGGEFISANHKLT
jgi:hypothetical protein